MPLTSEQQAAVQSGGRTIVSASAGSGKTTVMIQKLLEEIKGGLELENVLAVTFTKKAAAQMKEKLRRAIIEELGRAEGEQRARLRRQLDKIPAADISTIHSFCARLIRTYFYAAGVDGTFGIVSDDPSGRQLKTRALDKLFDDCYERQDENLLVLLRCFGRRRSDMSLRALVLSSYEKLCSVPDYRERLESAGELFSEEGFDRVCEDYLQLIKEKLARLERSTEKFALAFKPSNAGEYKPIFLEMLDILSAAQERSLFEEKPPFKTAAKPRSRKDDSEETREAGERYKAFREQVNKAYAALSERLDREAEKKYFLESGEAVKAFCAILLQFEREYTAVKREENRLDYNDLEHLALSLVRNEEIRREIAARYRCVFVDEYQDVNAVQEGVISGIGAEKLFLVGDVKQAIYGFRGSRSEFFAGRFRDFSRGEGNALRLSVNFRSSDEVLEFVNGVFSQIMTLDRSGIDYERDGVMYGGGAYPAGSGGAKIHIFGGEKEERPPVTEVYSVEKDVRGSSHTREGLAVLEIVRRELAGKRYDPQAGGYVDVRQGDICILTRKGTNASAAGIARALSDAGYSVSGARSGNLLLRTEVRQLTDILSYIDNPRQDIAATAAMLSPLGGLTADELGRIRTVCREGRFYDGCKKYASLMRDGIARKLKLFYERCETLRDMSDVCPADRLIDEALSLSGLSAQYSEAQSAAVKKLREAAAGRSLAAFLNDLRENPDISAPEQAGADCIRVMTMHAAKGLEFPIVIIADICATYKGRDYEELPFDLKYGFAPKYYSVDKKTSAPTVLRRLCAARADEEELRNEYNLFYVAATRAMCRLHILSEELPVYSEVRAANADCYADMFDLSAFDCEKMTVPDDFSGVRARSSALGVANLKLKRLLDGAFEKPYFALDSVDLPVKSSASALLKEEDGEYVRAHRLFYDGETTTESGTAYHRFLELCDFSVRDSAGIGEEAKDFAQRGLMTAEQVALLDFAHLSKVLSIPVFERLKRGAYREREFLCRLPANRLFDTEAQDFVLVQGAMDAVLIEEGRALIADYKYSSMDDEFLREHYKKQLDIYRRALSAICGIEPENIETVLVNIRAARQIEV